MAQTISFWIGAILDLQGMVMNLFPDFLKVEENIQMGLLWLWAMQLALFQKVVEELNHVCVLLSIWSVICYELAKPDPGYQKSNLGI